MLRRIAAGDEQAFAALLRDHWRNIYSHALTYVKSAQQAEELTQDIFMRLWDARGKLPELTSLDNYLFIIARNSLVSAVRKKLSVTAELESTYPEEHWLNPDRRLEYKEQYALLLAGIDQLPDKRREVFILSRLEGLTHSEIALKLGIHKDTVAQYIVKAINFLRSYLEEKGSSPLVIILLLAGQL